MRRQKHEAGLVAKLAGKPYTGISKMGQKTKLSLNEVIWIVRLRTKSHEACYEVIWIAKVGG
jgi:hypothetical protein